MQYRLSNYVTLFIDIDILKIVIIVTCNDDMIISFLFERFDEAI